MPTWRLTYKESRGEVRAAGAGQRPPGLEIRAQAGRAGAEPGHGHVHAHVRRGFARPRREARQTGRDMLHGMGRDRTRVLLCAAVSLVLILAATLTMDWYLRVFEVGDEVSRVSIDLVSVRTCTTIHVCTTTPLGPPGMFSTLATVTMWSSLAFAALVAYQAGARLLTGNANDTI